MGTETGEARKAENVGGVVKGGNEPPSYQLRDLGQRCKLPQRGPCGDPAAPAVSTIFVDARLPSTRSHGACVFFTMPKNSCQHLEGLNP